MIKLTPEELRTSANKLNGYLSSMKNNLKEAESIIIKSKESYDSESAEQYRNQFENLKKDAYVPFENLMVELITTLKNAAALYEGTDQRIAKNVQNS